MSLEYDEKGKIFTDVVTKVPVAALIQTTTHLVRGNIHVRSGQRLKDELDRDEPYIAVTDATVLGDGEKLLYTVNFLAVRRGHIVWVMPDEARRTGREK